MAIIGYGGMGRWHLKQIRDRIEHLTVKGVYDLRKEAQDKALEDGLVVYDTAEALLNDQEIELVLVATPNNFHKDYAIAVMKAGKNVICEKPVAMNAEELKEMIACSKETGKLFSIHQNRRWDKDYLIVKKVVSSHMLGEPYFIESRVLGSRRAMYGWRGHKMNGGGMVLDWGVHLIDQLLDLIPAKVVSVDAHLFNLYSDEVDDNIKIFLRFENGISTECEMATNCLITQPRWHISCMEGTMEIDDWGKSGKIVQLKEEQQMTWDNDIVYSDAGPTRTMAKRPAFTTVESKLPTVEGDWSSYYKNILAVLDQKEELIVKPEQALRVMQIIDLVFETQRVGHGLACEI